MKAKFRARFCRNFRKKRNGAQKSEVLFVSCQSSLVNRHLSVVRCENRSRLRRTCPVRSAWLPLSQPHIHLHSEVPCHASFVSRAVGERSPLCRCKGAGRRRSGRGQVAL